MPISKAMRTALRALSYPGPDIRRTYRVEREVKRLTGRIRPSAEDKTRRLDSCVCCPSHVIPLRLYFPAVNNDRLIHPGPTLLFFHGGGWVMGCIESHDQVCSQMARLTGCIVVSVEYRLAPEFPYPAAVEDCYAAAKALSEGRILPGVGPEQVVLVGDSAGGNLAAAISLMARDRMEIFPAGQILLYPALYNDYGPDNPYPSVRENGTDYLLTAKRMGEFVEMYRGPGAESVQDSYFAPLLAKNFSHQPPTLMITAEYCPLRDEGEDYADKLGKAGGIVRMRRISDALHNFFFLPIQFRAVRESYGEILRFLDLLFPHRQGPQAPWPSLAREPETVETISVISDKDIPDADLI